MKEVTNMHKKTHKLDGILFWGFIFLAVTAESWMDGLCRLVA